MTSKRPPTYINDSKIVTVSTVKRRPDTHSLTATVSSFQRQPLIKPAKEHQAYCTSTWRRRLETKFRGRRAIGPILSLSRIHSVPETISKRYSYCKIMYNNHELADLKIQWQDTLQSTSSEFHRRSRGLPKKDRSIDDVRLFETPTRSLQAVARSSMSMMASDAFYLRDWRGPLLLIPQLDRQQGSCGCDNV